MSEILDSRDLEEEIQELKTLIEDREATEIDHERYQELRDLREEVGGCGWEYGIIFIPMCEWENYCREFTEELEYIKYDNQNPLYNCINWEAWADLMQLDYSEIEFDGITYYWREA